MGADLLQPGRENGATREKVAFLRAPDNYPDHPTEVEIKETHMSWVFLTNEYVYKLKKPVRYAFLDFSTVEARHRDCEQELRLNRRLAPDVYLAVVPLTVEHDGHIALGGSGTAIDWLVKMRRLPQERMLDELIRRGVPIEARDIDAVAHMLSAFYGSAPTAELTGEGYRARLHRDLEATCRALLDESYPLSTTRIETIRHGQLTLLARRPKLFDARVEQGLVVEGHGDLRPEHVCLTSPPAVIDCLEFNREFRLLDQADEVAFLAMECDSLGAPETGAAIFAAYQRVSHDCPPPPLIAFYKTFRACLRAKLAIWHIQDHQVPNHAKWIERARNYLALAESYADRLTES